MLSFKLAHDTCLSTQVNFLKNYRHYISTTVYCFHRSLDVLVLLIRMRNCMPFIPRRMSGHKFGADKVIVRLKGACTVHQIEPLQVSVLRFLNNCRLPSQSGVEFVVSQKSACTGINAKRHAPGETCFQITCKWDQNLIHVAIETVTKLLVPYCLVRPECMLAFP
jgi:hypothetical protein